MWQRSIVIYFSKPNVYKLESSHIRRMNTLRCLPLISSSTECIFCWGQLPLRLSSIEIFFHWGLLPLRLSSIEVVFHWSWNEFFVSFGRQYFLFKASVHIYVQLEIVGLSFKLSVCWKVCPTVNFNLAFSQIYFYLLVLWFICNIP